MLNVACSKLTYYLIYLIIQAFIITVHWWDFPVQITQVVMLQNRVPIHEEKSGFKIHTDRLNLGLSEEIFRPVGSIPGSHSRNHLHTYICPQDG